MVTSDGLGTIGEGRRSWSNPGTIPPFVWRDLGKPRSILAKTAARLEPRTSRSHSYVSLFYMQRERRWVCQQDTPFEHAQKNVYRRLLSTLGQCKVHWVGRQIFELLNPIWALAPNVWWQIHQWLWRQTTRMWHTLQQARRTGHFVKGNLTTSVRD
jgi:hypothetical protein